MNHCKEEEKKDLQFRLAFYLMACVLLVETREKRLRWTSQLLLPLPIFLVALFWNL